MPFVSSLNKDVIRYSFDRDVIKNFEKSEKKKLTYFGLPGPEILDIKEWKNNLCSVIAVERDEISAQLLLDNIFKLDFNLRNFQLLHGDIDNILIDGKDKYGTPIKFPFNLINLDYEGGILYKDLKGGSKKIKAIEHLFERQREAGKNFLLFFTFNSRNKDEKEFIRTIDAIEENLSDYNVKSDETEFFFDWYREQRYDCKIKIYVLHLINTIALTRQFECKFYPPVTYMGLKARMVHFVFELEWVPDIHPRLYNLINILNTQMKESKNGKIVDFKLPILKF